VALSEVVVQVVGPAAVVVVVLRAVVTEVVERDGMLVVVGTEVVEVVVVLRWAAGVEEQAARSRVRAPRVPSSRAGRRPPPVGLTS
jgi:hypothetical protein